MDVIIMIRHPASFISSLIAKKRQHPFDHFLAQQELMDKKLRSFAEEISEYVKNPHSIIDQGIILLWRIIYSVVHRYKIDYDGKWLFLNLKDIAVDPWDGFARIYQFLGMDWNDAVKNKLIKNLQAGKYKKNEMANHDLKHDFQIGEQITYYNRYLTNVELNYIKEKTGEIWPLFYEVKDWVFE